MTCRTCSGCADAPPPYRGFPVAAAVLLLLLGACGPEPLSPQQQVRAYIAAGEAAAEARELGRLRALIAPDYADELGRTRPLLLRIVAGYFLRHKSIHILTRIQRLKITGDDSARVLVYAATASTPIGGVEQLLGLRADLHRFDLRLGRDEEGEWRLLSATWRRARLEDFSANR